MIGWRPAVITAVDVPTIEAILSPTFKYINSEGGLINRAEEVAMALSAQETTT